MDINVYSFDLIDDKGKSFEKVEDVFYLPHNSYFKIVFYNKNNKRVDVKFIVDGVDVGEFRSHPHSNIKLERPVNKEKVFKFVSANSEEGKQGRLYLVPNLGTVEIRVDTKQEYKRNVVYDSIFLSGCVDEIDGLVSTSLGAGGTVLGKHSDQYFTIAKYMSTAGQIVKLFAKMIIKNDVSFLILYIISWLC